MERLLTCECTTSECDSLACGSVVSTTVHGHGVADHYAMKSDSGDCIEMQVAPKAHHPNKSSGLGHGCPPNEQHPSEIEPIANYWQYDDLSAIGESYVEDLAVVEQPPPEDNEEAIPLVSDDEIAIEASEGISPHPTVEISSQKTTETLNVLVNDGSSIGTYQLDLIAPPKTTSEITQLPTLEQKRFLRDLRSGKVKQICVLVFHDEYVTDIRLAVVFAEDKRVLSSSLMNESVLDEKTRIERYTSQSWESLQANPLYKGLIEFKDVFPESVPCELP
uniref:Uncharacterized protein n=1 Tax=Hyaloperonospora arabidopsidis (strain Emoy2) TaxID=559515 RepID=M4BJM7_HYAAE